MTGKQKLLLFSFIFCIGYLHGRLKANTSTEAASEFISEEEMSPSGSEKLDIYVSSHSGIARLKNRIESYMEESTSNHSVPAASLKIYVDNRPLVEKNSNFTDKTPVSIASVTKSFTAFAVMQLVESGFIDLDKPVSFYLEGFNPDPENKFAKKITVRNLLNQTSGIPYQGRSKSVHANIKNKNYYIPVQKYPAGVYFEYSNHNYQLLLLVIEKVTGETYADFLSRTIFKPLGMKDTNASHASGAGGIISTSSDLAKFGSMLASGGVFHKTHLISEKSMKKLFAPPENITDSEKMFYYGMGFRIIRYRGKTVAFYHTGIHKGTLAELMVFPELKSFSVHVANPLNPKSPRSEKYRYTMTDLCKSYVSQFVNLYRVERVDNLNPSLPTKAQMNQYQGKYRNVLTGDIIEIILNGKNLYRKKWKTLDIIYPRNTIEFTVHDLYNPLQFVWSEDKVKGLAEGDGFYRRI